VTLPKTADRTAPDALLEGGQALVEFVLALPPLLLVLLAILQFGIVMNDYVEVSDAARVGARKASLSRKAPAPAGVAETAARGSASQLDQGDLDVRVTPETAWRKGDPVKVRVAYPYKIDVFGLVFKEGMMTFEATARVQ
jgi:Flp pilus assembly protein TadG